MKEPVKNKNAAKEKEVVLDEKTIQEWKKKWGKIFKTTVDGESYIWRKLKRKEYVEIMSSYIESEEDEDSVIGSRIYHRQEKIAKTVVLYPSDIESRIEENAGLATSISDEVVLKSGFDVAATEEL